MVQKSEAAKRLAEIHYLTDATTTRIARVTDAPEVENQPDTPIILLEANTATIPSGIVPLRFDAHPQSGIDYPSVIIEVTPEEFAEVQAGRLELPGGWRISEILSPPPDIAAV